MFSKSHYVAVDIGGDVSKTRNLSIWRKWKQMTSFQKKVFVFGTCVLLSMIVILSTRSSSVESPVKTPKHIKEKKPKINIKLKEDPDDQIKHPALAQLDDEKKKSLQELFDKVQQDFVDHPMEKIPPKIRAKWEKVNINDKGDMDADEQMQGLSKKADDQEQDFENDDDEEEEQPEEVQENHPDAPAFRHLSTVPVNERQKFIVNMFQHAWKGYKQSAWGHDHAHPISKTNDDWFGVALTMLDAVDTMYIMGLETEYAEVRDYIAKKLTFNVNSDVNLFECTIRVLGSMLSMFHISGDELYRTKSMDIAKRLLPALTSSASSVPLSDVNLRTGNAHPPRWGPDSTVSEITTIQLEFRDVTFISGDQKYKDAVDKASDHIASLSGKKDGLIPMWVNANTGLFRPGGTFTVGARADSYYEYLLKQWVQTNRTEEKFLHRYLEAVDGIKAHLIGRSLPNSFVYVGELIGGVTPSPKMDHLVCFLPGTLALGATLIAKSHPGKSQEHMSLAKDVIATCNQMYTNTPTGLSPEITYFNLATSGTSDLIVKPLDRHNLLRPETVESLFYMWRLTKDPTYREWGWAIAQAFEKYTKVDSGGYTSIKNVMDPNRTSPFDKMESFFLGETLKYLYLLFSDDDSLMALDKWVFNTEAHPFPIRSSQS